MALNTITPSNREEEYLSAIAGDEGASAPVPSNRHEEWLRRIAGGQSDQTERLDHIEDQIPVDPTSADVGKVMTVIADESGEEPVYKWSAEAAGGGCDCLFLIELDQNGNLNKTWSEIDSAAKAGKRCVLITQHSDPYDVYIESLNSILYDSSLVRDPYRLYFAAVDRSSLYAECYSCAAGSDYPAPESYALLNLSYIPIGG